MDICTEQANPTGCGHHQLTVTVDGVPVALHLHDSEALEPLTAAELETFVRLSVRRLRQKGVTLAQFLQRVTHGEEATNVKQYDLIAAGSVITKTNIGTAYSNILPGANGQRSLVDFTGATEFRVVLNANLVGTGQWGARVVRDGDSAVLFDAPNLGAVGERELDTDWQTLPEGFDGLTLLRLQAKSQTATDDPQFRRCVMLVR